MRGFLETRLTWLAALLLALCVVGYPVAGLIAATMDWPSRWASVPFRAVVALLALTVAVLMWRSQPLNRWSWLLGVWLALYSIRLSSNVLEGHPAAMHEILFFCLAVVLPVLAFLKCNLRDIEPKVRTLIIWLGTGILTIAIAGEYLGWFGANSYTFSGRLSTSTLNPITLGHVAASLLLASVAWSAKNDYKKLLIALSLMSLSLVGMSYAGSRGPFVALIAALAVFLFATPKGGGIALVHRVKIVSIMGLAIWLMWNPLPMNHLITQSSLQRGMSNDVVESRLTKLEGLQQDRLALSDEASETRQKLLMSSLAAFLANPVFGVSNWTANEGQYPHNLALEAFQNLGIAGGSIFLLLLVVGSFRAWGRIRHGEYMVPLLFFQALVGGQFSGSLYAHAQLWTSLALLLGSSVITGKQQTSEKMCQFDRK